MTLDIVDAMKSTVLSPNANIATQTIVLVESLCSTVPEASEAFADADFSEYETLGLRYSAHPPRFLFEAITAASDSTCCTIFRVLSMLASRPSFYRHLALGSSIPSGAA